MLLKPETAHADTARGLPELSLTDALASAQEVAAEAAARFNRLMPRVVRRVLGEGEQAQQALQTGGFVLDDAVIVMRLNSDSSMLEFFCDIGQPQPQTHEANFRTALQMNLCRTHPGVTFGLHPESGRLVATSAMHMMLFADDEVCFNALQMLAGLVRQLRADRTFLVED
ncbi:MAG: hypothetical protein RIS88_2413 [Pseudomonadota bacterium]|jgi:hypothetical protein